MGVAQAGGFAAAARLERHGGLNHDADAAGRRSFDTAFRLHDKLFGKAEAVAFRTPETDDTPYLATINLMTV
ncbi:hypothetical protein [Kingella potus]|uniref:hypothetical protein n=1 Tax=Kingella potus TaxID=265175 RepID=UPI001FD4742B|nr:hypothetical protein [Kingella potus]UOP00527.1 hypothetical protein LVJ84_11900 [Kingella potus]